MTALDDVRFEAASILAQVLEKQVSTQIDWFYTK